MIDFVCLLQFRSGLTIFKRSEMKVSDQSSWEFALIKLAQPKTHRNNSFDTNQSLDKLPEAAHNVPDCTCPLAVCTEVGKTVLGRSV